MSANTPEAAFIDAAHALSHAAPDQWRDFVAAFDAYSTRKCVDAVQTQMDQAHVARGHAQGYLLLAGLLTDLEARYRALHTKKR